MDKSGRGESPGFNRSSNDRKVSNWATGNEINLATAHEISNNQAYVDQVNEKEECVNVLFEGGRRETYYSSDSDRLTLAYAMTVHKAQGSEMKAVILCLQDCNGFMLKRSIPYTGITRAQEQVVFMGSIEALEKAIRRDDKYERKTVLKEILKGRM